MDEYFADIARYKKARKQSNHRRHVSRESRSPNTQTNPKSFKSRRSGKRQPESNQDSGSRKKADEKKGKRLKISNTSSTSDSVQILKSGEGNEKNIPETPSKKGEADALVPDPEEKPAEEKRPKCLPLPKVPGQFNLVRPTFFVLLCLYCDDFLSGPHTYGLNAYAKTGSSMLQQRNQGLCFLLLFFILLEKLEKSAFLWIQLKQEWH